MDIGAISVIGGLTISLITIVGNFIMSGQQKRVEYKREIYITVLNISYEEWKANTELTLELAKINGGTASFYPYDEYLLYYTKLIKLLEKDKLTEIEIKNMMSQFKNTRDIIRREHQS